MSRYYSIEDIREEYQGREYETFSAILSAEEMSGKHQPCPVCGGTDRFRFDKKKVKAYCNHIGKYMDAAEYLIHRSDFVTACNEMKSILGMNDNTIDQEALKAAQLARAEDKAKKSLESDYRRLTNRKVLDRMFELEQMIMRRGDDKDPCEEELDIARDLFLSLKNNYKSD
jgi:phage/plasmid primase-like uncharacterized protein